MHAEGVVRESGVLTLTTDPALTAVVTAQSGLRQTAAEVAGASRRVERIRGNTVDRAVA